MRGRFSAKSGDVSRILCNSYFRTFLVNLQFFVGRIERQFASRNEMIQNTMQRPEKLQDPSDCASKKRKGELQSGNWKTSRVSFRLAPPRNASQRLATPRNASQRLVTSIYRKIGRCERDEEGREQHGQTDSLLVFLAGGRLAKIRRTSAIYRMTFIYAPTKPRLYTARCTLCTRFLLLLLLFSGSSPVRPFVRSFVCLSSRTHAHTNTYICNFLRSSIRISPF